MRNSLVRLAVAGAGVAACAPSASLSKDHETGAGAASGGSETVLFDGTLGDDWRMTTIKNQPGRDDPGHFAVENGALVAYPGTDLGLLWNNRPAPADFVLELEWRLASEDDNSGVFVRFPDPESRGYDNAAWVAIQFGFEVQINEPGFPDGAPKHTTGAIYDQDDQDFTRVVALPPGAWNAFAIAVQGDAYTVTLNGQSVTRFVNRDAARGRATTPAAPSFIGLQTHTGHVAYRNIRIRAL
jgi:hypothetical protein